MTEENSLKRKEVAEDEIAAKKVKLDQPPAAVATPPVKNDEAPQKPETSKSSEPENSKGSELTKDDPPKPAPALSKPVFGAASTFGNASIFEKMKNKTNVFETSPAKSTANSPDLAKSATSSFGSFGAGSFGAGSFGASSFGANSKFSNALQKATQKKSFLDEPKEETNGDVKSPSSSSSSQQYKQVELTEKKVETGEENENSVFSTTAKLFELDLSNIAEGWKERGRGPLHLNQSISNPSQARLVMRSNGLLRVILNYKITATTALIKGLEASLSPGKFLRVTSVSAEGKPVQYMLKFLNQEIRDELCTKVSALKEEIQSASGVEQKKTPQATGFRFIDDSEEKKDEAGPQELKLQRTNTDVDAGNE